ncbi:GIY-YIG nuclease family protein [bacterium]|nr:GIY-YIG nuclease family protein [bacterium]
MANLENIWNRDADELRESFLLKLTDPDTRLEALVELEDVKEQLAELRLRAAETEDFLEKESAGIREREKRLGEGSKGEFLEEVLFDESVWAKVLALLPEKDTRFWLKNFTFEDSPCLLYENGMDFSPQLNLKSLDAGDMKLFHKGLIQAVTTYLQREGKIPVEDCKVNGQEFDGEIKESRIMGFVYLIRNGDLHEIGITENLSRRMKQFSPDDIVNTVKYFNYKDLEQQLHSLFSSKRLPQSEYFRLDYDDLLVVQQIMISRAET